MTGEFAVHHQLACAAEPVSALVQALKAVQLGVSGYHAGDVFIVTMVVEPAVVAHLVDCNNGRPRVIRL